jgi:GNAT superfamily N-acetyltransferase
MVAPAGIELALSPPVSDADLNALFAASWPDHVPTAFQAALKTSMAYVCGYQGRELVGFVNAAWDGKSHAFVLDTTVRPSHRHLGIGRSLVQCVIEEARRRGVAWVHVDFEPHLQHFYAQCGFRSSLAGVLHLAGSHDTHSRQPTPLPKV